jgi:GcrA cell cycle regulator
MAWTEELDTRLRTLAGEGYSTAVIAQTLNNEFGTVFSRNAVIGRAGRRGVKLLKPWVGKTISRARPRKPEPERRIKLKPLEAHPPREPMPVMRQEETANPVTLLELTHSSCRWPLGDTYTPATHFCGADRTIASPYCPAHTRRAYHH